MKALSLRPPWGELILQSRKTIETRTWRTAHRGTFAIHAAWHVDSEIATLYNSHPESLVSGALIGTAEIVEMIEFDDESWNALRDQHLVPDPTPNGRVGWRLANPRRLAEPIPMRGLPGLFPLDPEIIEQMRYE
jgi:activating signal cointegrator 1